ncbi:MAG: dienelactone hydrolase family protein [Candidatus Eremiobacteraeota bacterium]|nr:dienelactone hydrolase family protein [Candidatus Eremiobacteraeota bacterium]MBV8366860.1 dienelactone hydrolase family protein [Candidatus Eremiobacteraeota bacterium]
MPEVLIDTDRIELEGALALPAGASGLVIFAHGSGSSRRSPRNQFVARMLYDAGLATLLFDLLTGEEDAYDQSTAALRFDIALLARRLVGAVDWSRQDPRTRGLPIGLFGASTGAAATLVVAAQRPEFVRAVVSRGGRPDLAGVALARVKAPTLLIVGALDHTVLALNAEAARSISAHNEISVVPGASHLFEERGALDGVAELAVDWFTRYLIAAQT